MIIFSLIVTTILFIWYFYQINITRLGILPVAIIVALFFGSGIQASHKSWIKQYLESHLQSFSWILINIGFQIIMSLYNVSRTLGSVILLSINALLLWLVYLSAARDRQAPLRAWIVFHGIIYLITWCYTAYLMGDRRAVVSLIGMILALVGAFWSIYHFIIWYFVDLKETNIKYEWILIYHCLLIIVILKLYLESDPFIGLIVIQVYITIVLLAIAKIKSSAQALHTNASDMDVEYILRGYRINQIPTRMDSINTRLMQPNLQQFVNNVPALLYTALSVSSIIVTLIFCGLIIYHGQANNLYLWDFTMFLINTGLYLLIFYLCKKIGIQDKLWRFFGFIAINVCYFIAVAQIFKQDTISVLFWSILWSVGNNIALNYMQELRSYLGKSDYQYWLMSNFFGLLIIIYFFLWLNLDVLLKVAIVVMTLGLWLLLNKDNLKEMMEKSE
jgi:hypothetical protein